MPSVPGRGVPWLHPKPCCKRSSSALLGIINGRVWGSQGEGKDINLEIKCCCLVTSPELPYFAARPSWSPVSVPALGAMGTVGWVQPGSGRGRCPLGVLLCGVMGMRRGLGAFPRYWVVLTSPGQPLGAQLGVRSRWSSQQGAGNAPLLLCKAKGPAPVPGAVVELRAYLGWMRCTHTHTRDKLTMARVMPQILKPYVTLLFNMADFVRW